MAGEKLLFPWPYARDARKLEKHAHCAERNTLYASRRGKRKRNRRQNCMLCVWPSTIFHHLHLFHSIQREPRSRCITQFRIWIEWLFSRGPLRAENLCVYSSELWKYGILAHVYGRATHGMCCRCRSSVSATQSISHRTRNPTSVDSVAPIEITI